MFEFYSSSLYQVWSKHFSSKNRNHLYAMDQQTVEIKTESDRLNQQRQLEETAVVRRIAETYWLERRYFG